jgi:hypothetical protein
MTQFGVTPEGFVPKELTDILGAVQQRVRDVFGADADLSPTSPLAKILQVTADEDALLWRRMQDVYYSQFVSTASGADLDLLGDDAGITRRHLSANGQVTLAIGSPQPGRVYLIPAGTMLVAANRPAFVTTQAARLDEATPSANVPARAAEEGPDGNIAAGAITGVDPDYLRDVLGILPPTTLAATNPAPFTGGQLRESDVDYRARQLGFPREIWTPRSVRAAVLEIPGVFDVLLAGPLGGVDVSQSLFNLFLFGQRAFGAERPTGEPYYFDVIVASDPIHPWRTTGQVTGIYEQALAKIDRVRPVGVLPSVVPANRVDVGVRATVIADPGFDVPALRTGLLDRLAADLGALRLGGDVLFSHVMRLLVEQQGVLDVQDMRLRRSPGAVSKLTPGGPVIEMGPGENLTLAPAEVAVFAVDSELFDIQVVGR